MPAISSFNVILLDQGKTFMFENDRFGPDVDYAATYRDLGGADLSPARVQTVVARLFDHFLALGRDPARFDSFPTIPEAIRNMPELAVPKEEWDRIDELFAIHELGVISARHAHTIHALAATHRLGVVSNIWATPTHFVANLERAGVRGCFEHLVWSSEQGCIKPSPRLFRHALRLFGVPPECALFVGDHPVRDIDAAKSLGLATTWIRNGTAEFPMNLRKPDWIIDDLTALPELLLSQQPSTNNLK
jgi:putative hydrolase of the HAD superfamily